MKEEIPALTQPPASQQASAEDAERSSPGETRDLPENRVPEQSEGARQQPDGEQAPAGDVPAVPPPAEPAVSEDTQPERGRSTLGWWALLVAVVAVGGAGWSIWQVRDTQAQAVTLREELAKRLSEGESVASEARGIVRQQQEVIASLQGKLGALESKVEVTEGQAEALQAMYQELSRSREEGVVAEVEQAVALAAQQLQIAGNVEAALIALQEAEARLALHDRGQLSALRRALGGDIDELRLLPALDVSGLSIRLERLLEHADAMPLAFERPLSADAAVGADLGPAQSGGFVGWVEKAWRFSQAVAADVWHEVRTVIRVERMDGKEPVLLAPEQSSFLRENLKLRLLTARLALLARDGRTYETDLAQARGWVERFFDQGDERVKLVLSELQALGAVKIRYTPPDLSETFTALRNLQVRAGRPPQPVEPPKAAAAPADEVETEAASAASEAPEPESAPATDGLAPNGEAAGAADAAAGMGEAADGAADKPAEEPVPAPAASE